MQRAVCDTGTAGLVVEPVRSDQYQMIGLERANGCLHNTNARRGPLATTTYMYIHVCINPRKTGSGHAIEEMGTY